MLADQLIWTNSLEQRPSWKANSPSASQDIPCLLWNPKVTYHVYVRPKLHPILGQINPVQTLTPYLF